MNISDRIQLLRGEKTLEVFAKEHNTNASTVHNYEKGRNPSAEFLQSLANKGININWVLTGEGSVYLTQPAPKRKPSKSQPGIPILTKCPAGKPHAWFAEDRLATEDDVYDLIPHTPYIYGLRVDGDSMFPYVYPGDVVIVDPDRELHSGDLVVARIGSDGHTLKYVRFNGKTVTLIPENPSYETIVHDRNLIEFLGKVVAVVRDNTNGRRGQYTMDVVEVLKNEQVFGLSLMLAEMPEEFVESMNVALTTQPPEPDREDVYRWVNWMQRIYRRGIEEIEKILKI